MKNFGLTFDSTIFIKMRPLFPFYLFSLPYILCCDCAIIRNLNFDNAVTLNSSIFKFELSARHLPDSRIEEFPFELTSETTVIEV